MEWDYDDLGVSKNASADEIHAAFRKLPARYQDVIVKVRVEIPRRLTPAQRRLLEQARQTR